MSEKTQKAIFLDRNDTLVDDPGKPISPDQIRLLPGAIEALGQLKKMGYLLFVIADPPPIAQGQHNDLHYRLKSILVAEGSPLDGIYEWPQHPDGAVKNFSMEINLQQRDSAVLELAAEEAGIDLKSSWMIGDTYRDMKAGKEAGCQTILVDVPGKTRNKLSTDPEPDRKAVNLREAVNIVRMYEFHRKAQTAKKNVKETESPQTVTPVKEIAQPAEKPKPACIKMAVPATAEKQKQEQPPQTESRAFTPEKPVEPQQPVKKFHTAKKTPTPVQEQAAAEHPDKTYHLLEEILLRLKSHGRTEMYDDFSVFKLLAIMVQVITLACMAFSLVAWMSREANTDKVQILIGYAVVLQLLVIALLMMHRRD